MIVLIPSYKPDFRLLSLLDDLEAAEIEKIIVVDDGCGAEYAKVFDNVRARGHKVLVHEVNCGKGRALKTGFTYILEHFPGEGAVIADSDGQSILKDIMAVGEMLDKNPDTMILGTRKFVGDVPLRSQLGNSITRAVFLWATGRPVADTQTGLRGIPHYLMKDIINMRGERFELEMNMLLTCAKMNVKFKQVPIETIYFDDNSGSHFKAIPDSIRIYKIITLFSIVSILAMLVDIGVFALLAYGCLNCAQNIWPIIGCVAGGRAAAFLLKRFGQKAHIIEWKDELIKLAAYSLFVYLLSFVGSMGLIWARVLASTITGICFMIALNEKARRENVFEQLRQRVQELRSQAKDK